MNRIRKIAGAVAIAGVAWSSSAMLAGVAANASPAPKSVQVVFPCPNEDSQTCYVAYIKGVWHLHNGRTDALVTSSNKTYGDYYNHAWRLVIFPR